MALTPSNMMPLGTQAPEFSLSEVRTNKKVSLESGKKGYLVMFICNHCPYVKHIQSELVKLGNDYISRGIQVVGISSNDVVNYPEDHPTKMKEVAEEWKYPFSYVFDEDQSVARAYDAACTPDFFLFDASKKCYYRGQLDDSRPKNEVPVTGKDLRQALENLLQGKAAPEIQKASMGCNIKFKG